MDLSQASMLISADSTVSHNSVEEDLRPGYTLASNISEPSMYSSQQRPMPALQPIQQPKMPALQPLFTQQDALIQTAHPTVSQQHGVMDTPQLAMTQNNPVQSSEHDQPSTSQQSQPTQPLTSGHNRAPQSSTQDVAQESQPSSTQDGSEVQIRFCLVCGDKPTGCHYGVRACEGCKGFFKRTSKKDKIQACRHGNGLCPINISNRNQCIHCRYKKCLAMGMSREAVSVQRLLPKPIEEELEQPAEKDNYEMSGKEADFKCHCKYFSKKPCYSRYTQPELMALRNQYKALNKKELDIAVLAKLQTGMHMSVMTCQKKKKHSERKHVRSDHYIHGERICRETFCFIHRIAAKKLQTLMAHYRGSGVCKRIMKRQVMKERTERLRQHAKDQKLRERAKVAVIKLKLKQKKQKESMIRANNAKKKEKDDTSTNNEIAAASLSASKKKGRQDEGHYETDPALMVARHIEAMHQYVDIQIGQQPDNNHPNQHHGSTSGVGENAARPGEAGSQSLQAQQHHSMWQLPRRPDGQPDGSYLMPL